MRSTRRVRKALNFVLADKVGTVLETALVHKDADNKHEVHNACFGQKKPPGNKTVGEAWQNLI